MNQILSDVLFNRALIWLVLASLGNDNEWLKGAYIMLVVLNVVRSLKAYVEDA